MGFNIVLVEPEIPMNTGNIGRLSLASGSALNLVKPFGFQLDDKRLKRAGLDYWKHISVNIYENIEDFFKKIRKKTWYIFQALQQKIIQLLILKTICFSYLERNP